MYFHELKKILARINPEFDDSWVTAFQLSRCYYAQPVCVPEYRSMLPPIRSGIRGLLTADTSYYYPHDRSITESVKLGKSLAQEMLGAPWLVRLK